MDRLQQFAAIEAALNTIGTRISRLGYIFKETVQKTTTDDGLIDELVASAALLQQQATALKSVVYDPSDGAV